MLDSGQKTVIALQDYVPQGDDDLPLQKDQEYLLIKSSHPEWWSVQDNLGWVALKLFDFTSKKHVESYLSRPTQKRGLRASCLRGRKTGQQLGEIWVSLISFHSWYCVVHVHTVHSIYLFFVFDFYFHRWYNTNTTRGEAERLLMNEVKYIFVFYFIQGLFCILCLQVSMQLFEFYIYIYIYIRISQIQGNKNRLI